MHNFSLTLRNLHLSWERSWSWNYLSSFHQKVIGVALAIFAALSLICFFSFRKKELVQIKKSTQLILPLPQKNFPVSAVKEQDEKSGMNKKDETPPKVIPPTVVEPLSKTTATFLTAIPSEEIIEDIPPNIMEASDKTTEEKSAKPEKNFTSTAIETNPIACPADEVTKPLVEDILPSVVKASEQTTEESNTKPEEGVPSTAIGTNPTATPLEEVIKPPVEDIHPAVVEASEQTTGESNIKPEKNISSTAIERKDREELPAEKVLPFVDVADSKVDFVVSSHLSSEIHPPHIESGTNLEKEIESPELENVIAKWKSTLDEKEVLKNIGNFFMRQKPTPQLFAVCLKAEIIAEKIIDSNKEVKVQLLGCYTLWLLDSDNIGSQTKIISLINRLEYVNSSFEHDERRLFGAFLAKNCNSQHIPLLFKCFLEDQKRGLIMEGFLMALLKSNASADLLITVFKSYWPLKKNFDQAPPRCSSKILSLIQSEQTLQAIYSAVPEDQKERIKEHLKSSYSHKGVEYKLPLSQDILARVLN